MNWGTKIVLGMGLFISFIVAMGAKMIISNDDALVEKDYYEKGLDYDKRFNEKEKAVRDKAVPAIEAGPEGLKVTFNGPADYVVTCKRLADSKMDRRFKGAGEQEIFIPVQQLAPGAWLLDVDYQLNGQQYFVEQEIRIP